MTMDRQEKEFLVEQALKAQKRAYCPYSHYPVGAALLTRDGKIILGCNVENASFPMTNCAEKTAICNAISQGEKFFKAVAIVTKESGLPCGSCRQVFNEFCDPNFYIVCCNQNGEICLETTLGEILPHAFGPKNMQ